MSESEVSLYTLKKPPSKWEDDVHPSKASFTGSSFSSSYSSHHQHTIIDHQSRSRQSTLRVVDPTNSNLTVRNESRHFNTINFVPSENYLPGANLSLIDGMSPEDQENLLTEELLKVLTGAQSTVIQVNQTKPNQISFVVRLTNQYLFFFAHYIYE